MIKYFEYIKYILVAILFIFIAGLLMSGKTSKTEIAQVERATTEAMDMTGMTKAENQMIRRLYGLNVSDYEGVVLYTATSTMAVEELLIVKLKDEAQAREWETAIASRLASQQSSFEGYGADQTRLLKDHLLRVEGNYILYVVSNQAPEVRSAFLKAL